MLAVGGAAGVAALAWYFLKKKRQSAQPFLSENTDDEVLEAGMLLLEYAKEVPGLMPIAFLVNAIVKNADGADAESARLARHIEALEVLLLHAASLPAPLLTRLAASLEEAEGRLRNSSSARPFGVICTELQACVDGLTFEKGALAEIDLDPRGLFSSDASVEAEQGGGGGPGAEPKVGIAAAIDARRRAQAADEEQVRLLAERNRVLAEQVAAMQKVLDTQQEAPPLQVPSAPGALLPTSSQQRMSPQAFFNSFPVPPDEAERRIALHKRRIGGLKAPLPALDAVIVPIATGGVFGASLCGLTVTLMNDAMQTVLSFFCRTPDGAWVDGGTIGIASWPPIPRKLTNCQYVVASGDVECVNGGNLIIADEVRRAMMPSLAQGDPAIAEALAPGGHVAMLQAHAAKMRNGGGDADPMLTLALQTCSRSHQYLGAPIRVDECVVGALCAWFTDAAAVDEPGLRDKLQAKAAVVADVLKKATASA